MMSTIQNISHQVGIFLKTNYDKIPLDRTTKIAIVCFLTSVAVLYCTYQLAKRVIKVLPADKENQDIKLGVHSTPAAAPSPIGIFSPETETFSPAISSPTVERETITPISVAVEELKEEAPPKEEEVKAKKEDKSGSLRKINLARLRQKRREKGNNEGAGLKD